MYILPILTQIPYTLFPYDSTERTVPQFSVFCLTVLGWRQDRGRGQDQGSGRSRGGRGRRVLEQVEPEEREGETEEETGEEEERVEREEEEEIRSYISYKNPILNCVQELLNLVSISNNILYLLLEKKTLHSFVFFHKFQNIVLDFSVAKILLLSNFSNSNNSFRAPKKSSGKGDRKIRVVAVETEAEEEREDSEEEREEVERGEGEEREVNYIFACTP